MELQTANDRIGNVRVEFDQLQDTNHNLVAEKVQLARDMKRLKDSKNSRIESLEEEVEVLRTTLDALNDEDSR